MRFNSLTEWLSWQESLHPSEIDLGLDRVKSVLARMKLAPMTCPVITVAGTNGKGSSVAMLEAIYRAAGYRVGAYTSPHLLQYNERVRINGDMVDDQSFCNAFERIDQARQETSQETSLTYFEFGTLAAIEIFSQAELDVVIMEVGLGGRLDAVNVLDPDVALITTIDLDHAAWLGSDRGSVGREKAGIMRSGRPAVCGDLDPPQSVQLVAAEKGALLYLNGRDFDAEGDESQWRWWGGTHQRDALPIPALRGDFQIQNAAAVLMVVELLSERLPVSQSNIRVGLLEATVAGRFQMIPSKVPLMLDVAHNPQAVAALARNLRAKPTPGSTHAVVAMMADKDIEGILLQMLPVVDVWHVTSVAIPRAAGKDQICQVLERLGAKNVQPAASVAIALNDAMDVAEANDRVIVFGSFYTVAEALQAAYNENERK